MAEGIAQNWLDAAATGDPPAALIDAWTIAVRRGERPAYDALMKWLSVIRAERGWEMPAPGGEIT